MRFHVLKFWLLVWALGLAGAAVAADEGKSLVVWHAYRAAEKTAFEKVVADYNKASAAKKVKVTTLAVPYDAFADKITAAVPRGNGPDVFIFAQDRMGGWVEAGKTIEPIDFYLDDATKKRYLPSTLEAMVYRGTTYGLPLNFKVITMIYNKKLVPAPPRTSTELVAMAKKLTDKASGKFGLAYDYGNFYYHAAMMNAFGGKVFAPGPKPTLNDPANVKSVEYVMKWVEKDGILPLEPSTALITALFNDGKAAIVFNGPWFLGEIAPGIEYGLAVLPTIDEAGKTPMKPWMTVEGAFIAAPSKNKDAAYDFIKYLTDVEAGKVLALDGRQCPANQSVYADPKVGADPVLKAFRAQVEVAVPMPNVPEMTMVWTPATTAMNAIMKKSSTPKAALDDAQKAVAKDVAGLRKKEG
ncbi:MAG TPA: extracellular solute-binding protein [Myxococcales bacterium]|nr:extracellular solute-binding protein [Myxococcales bacterium]